MLAVVEVYGVLGEPHYHDVVGDRILSRAAVHGVGGKPIVHADIVVAFSTVDGVCATVAKDQVGGRIARYLIIAVASVHGVDDASVPVYGVRAANIFRFGTSAGYEADDHVIRDVCSRIDIAVELYLGT